MTGLGGDAFWLIYDAASQTLQGLNGSGRAAQSANIAFYRDQGFTEIPQRGPLAAITVPGAVDSWGVAHERLGQLPWADLLQPAIALATTGYPATGCQAYWTRKDLPYLTEYAAGENPFLPHGKIPEPGQVLTNIALATTLATIARDGARSLYQGELADRIHDHLKTVGGLLTAQDLAAHRSDWVEPISTSYRGHRVWQLPPNSQGFTVLQALNLIEGFDLQSIGHGTADYYHLLVEATKLAFADRDRWLTDPDFMTIPTDQLISKASDRCRAQIDMHQARPVPATAIGGDTVYTAVVDRSGNAVSVIQSLYFDFGSAVMVPGAGFVLQNRGSFFSLNPEHINCLAPGKRTFHTLMPGMVCTDNRPEWVLGTMGGEGQPQTQLALLTRILDYGFDPQTAIDLPRWLWGRTWGDTSTGLTLEGRIPANIRAELQRRGHPVKTAPDWTEKMGHAHMIHIDSATGALQGGCDRRSDGAIAVP
jgi:gamma-glutamyltranspeptidase/glutathione hydrolase